MGRLWGRGGREQRAERVSEVGQGHGGGATMLPGTGEPSAQLPAQTSWSGRAPSLVQLIISHPDCACPVTARDTQGTHELKAGDLRKALEL